MNKDEDRLNISEAAAILSIHRLTLANIIKKYEDIQKKDFSDHTDEEKKFRCPPYGRIGNKIVFSRKKLEKFIEDIIPR